MNSSLNRFFKVIWCKLRLTWVAVSEVASGQGKEKSTTRIVLRAGASTPQTAGENTRALWDGDHLRLVPLARLQQPSPVRLAALHSLSQLEVSRTLMTSALLTGGAVVAQPAPNALPTAGHVSAGQASISSNGANMVITQSTNRAAINWQTFNVGANAHVQFQQPSANSVTLNRVTSADPSQIFGRITANGQVVLTNPAGVYFSASARVDVGGILATTHSIGDADFMAGNQRYERNGSTGSVVNEGELKAALGGYIALLAPEVRNQGAVIAHMGTVAMASGEAVDLSFDSNNRLTSLRVQPSQIQALVDNQHAVLAPGGLVIISAQSMDRLVGGVVKNSGSIEATGLQQQGGRIVLSGSSKTENSGTLNVSNTQGPGGSVSLQGERIELQAGSQIDATGTQGGGTVLVGGNWQGSADPLLQATGQPTQQATTVTMDAGAKINASATGNGNGGTVVLWSDITKATSVTTAHGTILAKGGDQGGDGGRIETSGSLLVTDGVNGSAASPMGKAGEWLFDPTNVTIGTSGAASAQNNGSSLSASAIADLLNGGTSVTVTTYSGGGDLGDLTVNSSISKSSGNSDVTLTLRAANSIVINQAIAQTGGTGKLNVVIDADNNTGASTAGSTPDRDGGGIVILEANVSTGGGSVTIGGTEVNGFNGGDLFVGGSNGITVSTSGGAVDVKGNLIIANSSTDGFAINSAGGAINLRRAVDSGNGYSVVMGQRTWQDAFTDAQNRGGWLATIGSSLENALAIRAAGYSAAWLGGQRIINTNEWRWTADPTYNATTNPMVFFYQGVNTPTSVGPTGSGAGGTTAPGYFNNWNSWTNTAIVNSEPNNWNNGSPGVFSQDYESVLQFTGSQGKWNDLPRTILNSEVQRYVLETNLAPSRLTLNAGAGAVNIGAGVGFSKALSQLSVTASSTSVTGGGIITTGAQSYSSGLTVENSGRVNISGTTVTTQGPVSVKSTTNDVYLNAAFTNTATTPSTFNVEAARHIQLSGNASITSSTAAMNTTLWADTDRSGDGIIYFEGSGIDTKGGSLTFGKSGQNNTFSGSTVLVGGDVFFQRGSAQTLTTGGGALNIYGETIVANTAGLTISSGNGAVTLHGLLNSGNSYTFVPTADNDTWTNARTAAKGSTGGNSAENSTYLVTITSRLENSIAGLTTNYKSAWIGAYRDRSNANGGGDTRWYWADGPEAQKYFFNQSDRSTVPGYYAQFANNEPNGSSSGGEAFGQFFGSEGLWNDLNNNGGNNDYTVKGYVREANLAASPVTINAGTGSVNIQGGVGTSKALSSLNVVSSGTTVKGNGLITTGAQTYSSGLTVNDSSYTQAVNLQAGAGGMTVGGAMTVYGGSFEAIQLNTDITSTATGDLNFLGTASIGWSVRLATGKTITKSAGTGSLTFAGPGRIMSEGTILATGSAKLNVVMSAETDNGSTYGVGTGTITSNGGDVWIGGGSLTNTWSGLSVGSRWASGINTGGNANAIDIGGNITTNGGDVLMAGWTEHAGASDITAVYGPVTISTGSGNVTLMSRSNRFAVSPSAYKTTVNTTGTLTLAPLSGQAYNLGDLTITGTTAGGHFTGSDDVEGLVVQNVASLSGLVFGNYLGTGVGGDTAYSYQNNASSTTLGTAFSVNGPISVFGTDVNINANLNTSSAGTAGDVMVKATGNIVLASAKSITTNGGDAILWANSDGQSSNGGVFFKSGSAVTTAGGHIWVGGGSATTAWNGLAVGDGWAVSGRNVNDMGYETFGGDWYSGVALNQTTLSSGGGHIYIAGQRNTAIANSYGDVLGAGVLNYSGTGTRINAGAGTVTIKGDNTATGTIVFGIMTGLHPTEYTGVFEVKSSNVSTGNAIALKGTSSAGTGDGILIENRTRLLSTAGTGGGGIAISGTAAGSRNALSVGVGANPGILEVLSASGTIDVNVGRYPLLIANQGNFRLGSIAADPDVASSAANVVITSDGVAWTGNVPVRTTGTLTVKPSDGRSFASTFNTTSLNYSGITGLTIGHSQNTAGITIGSATAINGDITLYGGAIQLASAISANDITVHSDDVSITAALTATDTISFIAQNDVNSQVQATGSGKVTADKLVLKTVGHTYLTDTNSGANAATTAYTSVNTLAADNVLRLYLTNDKALTIGAVDSTQGITAREMLILSTINGGNLTVANNIATSHNTSWAVTLRADAAKNVGDATGGNVIIGSAGNPATTPTITTGAGGTVRLYTGSVAGSTGVTTMVGSGSGRFRYNSKYGTNNFTSTVGSGTYAIYREQPSLTVTPTAQTITYGDSPALLTTASLSTAQNGDTLAFAVPSAPSAVVYALNTTTAVSASGNSTAYFDAGSYTLGVGTLPTHSALGYALSTATDTLTVNPKAITVKANNSAKFYSQSDPTGYAGVSYTGLAAGEQSTGNNIAFSRAAAGTNPDNSNAAVTGETAGVYALTPSLATGQANPNYTVTYQPGSFTIVPVSQALIRTGTTSPASQVTTAVYGNEAQATVTGSTYVTAPNSVTVASGDASGFAVGDTITLLNSATTSLGTARVLSNAGGVIALETNVNFAAVTQVKNGAAAAVATTAHTVLQELQLAALNVDRLVVADHTKFAVGDQVSQGAATGVVRRVDTGSSALTIEVTAGTFVNDVVLANTTQSANTSTVSAFDPLNTLYSFKDGAGKILTLGIDAASGQRNIGTNRFDVGTYSLQAENLVMDAGLSVLGVKVSGTLDVTARALTLTGTKVYDGSATMAVALGNLVSGETLNQTGVVLSAKNAGTRYVSAIALANDGIFKASNYLLPSLAAAAAGVNEVTIDRRALSVSASKVYDGSTTVDVGAVTVNLGTVNGNANSGLVTGESLGVTGAIGNSARVATADKYLSSLTLTDASGSVGNYSIQGLTPASGSALSGLSHVAGENTLTITPRLLSVSLTNTYVSKVYDGTSDAKTGNGGSPNANFVPQFVVANAVAGDTFAANNLTYTSAGYRNASGVLTADVNVPSVVGATSLRVDGINITGLTSATASSVFGDYDWNSLTSVAATITARPLAVSGTGVSKVYDGTTGMSGVSVGFVPVIGQTESGVIPGQSLTVSGGVGAFTTPNAGVGVGYSLTSTGTAPLVLTATGNTRASNYSIPGGGVGTISGNDGVIYQRPLDIDFIGVTRVYDGTTAATVTANFANNAFAPVVGDDLVINRTAAFDTKNVGTGNNRVTVSGVTLGGAAAGNYTLSYADNNPLHSNEPGVGDSAGFNATAAGEITRLNSATWIGTSGDNWFNPANWASTADLTLIGVVPDLANVAHVVIPNAQLVSFADTSTGRSGAAQTGTVQLDSLTGSTATLGMSAGTLAIGTGGATLAGLNQTGGSLTSTGPLTIGNSFSQTAGSITLTGSGAHISITQTTGDLSWLSLTSGGNLTLTSPGKTTFGNTTVGGDLLSVSRGVGVNGGVAQSADTQLTVTGTSEFVAHTGTLQNAALTKENNFVGRVSFTADNNGSWNNVSVVDAVGGLNIGNISATGNLSLTSRDGAIEQESGSTIVVTGETNLLAGNGATPTQTTYDIRLDGGNNNFGGAVNVLAGDKLTLNDINSLTLGNVTITGDLDATAAIDLVVNGTLDAGDVTLNAGGNMALNGNINADTLDANADGSITQGINSVITVDGAANMDAGNSITLNGDLNAGNTTLLAQNNVTLNGNLDVATLDVTATDGSIALNGDVTADGVSLDAGDNIALNGIINADALDANADGSITQGINSVITVDGAANMDAGNSITLNGDLNAGNTTLLAQNNVTLNGNLDVATLDVTATDGSIALNGDVTADGVSLDAGDNIALNGIINADALDATADGSITQGNNSVITIDGPANLNAGDSIILNGDLNAGNTTLLAQNDVTLNGNLDVATLDVTATDGSIALNGDVTADGVSLDAGDNIALNGIINADALDATADGSITQGNNSVITIDGPANLNAGDSIILNGDLNAGNTTLLAQNDVTLNGNLDVATLDVTATDGGISQGLQGRITVLTGPTNLIAGTDIKLDLANDFNGTVNASGNDIALNDINDLTLGGISASGNLAIGAGGNLSQDASIGRGIEVLGQTNIVAKGSVVLGNPNNKFPQGVNVQAASYIIAGDSRKAAEDAIAKVAGSMPISSLQGIGLSNANTPQALVMTSGTSSNPSSSSSTSGASESNNSGITVDLRSASQPDAPLMVAVSLPKGVSTVGTGFSFDLPESIRSAVVDGMTVVASQADGRPLPSWLKFDRTSLRFEATATPDSALPLQLAVMLGGQRILVVISERTE